MKSELSRKRDALNRFYPGNPFAHPTKRFVILVVIIWFVSTLLCILAETDAFREPLLQTKNFGVNIVLMSGTASVIRMIRNYRKGKRS